MDFQKARKLFEEHVRSEKVRLHCREVEAVMRGLAKELGEDEEKWAMAGLLHDMDCDIEPDIRNQARKAVEILKEKTDCPGEVCHAILSHNEANLGIKRESKLDYALSAADNISGMIYAYALMRGTIGGMEPKGVKKKLKDKGFAATVRRELIYDIEKAGMELSAFLDVSIRAMQGIKREIGLR
ncbi:MAG: HD domain-containing protein [Candidatus Aenigmarchaeota archaeon]|nr:HD domain-containing protein [Candidatus Aenigmarchaeota archaeon]